MLTAAYVISFAGMMILPVVLWIYFRRRFALSWKLVLAGGLTFIASQVLHIPLVLSLGSFLKSIPLWLDAILLGLLAGLFEETARYILFNFVLKKSRSWKEAVLVGLGHGGTEAFLLGIMAALAFVNMMVYRTMDLSTVPGIPADQLELAKQGVAAYWSAPVYMAFVGFLERIFAICLHVSLSVMVLYGLATRKMIWFWLAVLWHTAVDGITVYIGQQVGVLPAEAIVGIAAVISLWIVLSLRRRFDREVTILPEAAAGEPLPLSNIHG